MFIEEICHVNIVVSDMEKSVSFYRDLLGLEVIFEKDIGSKAFSTGVGLKDVSARVVMLKAKNENTLLELFQYFVPVGKELGVNMPNAIPIGHIAFRVKEIDSQYAELAGRGVEFISPPQEIADGVKFCYFRDPDGALLELIEFPNYP